MAIGPSKLLVSSQSVSGDSSDYVDTGDANAVILEMWPVGAGTATVQLLDSADPTTGFFPTVEASGLQSGKTARTKVQVNNVLPYVKVRITVTAGVWSVRVTPILSSGSTTINAAISGAVDQGAPNAGGVLAWLVGAADGAIVALGALADAGVYTDAAGTVSAKLRGVVAHLAAAIDRTYGWIRALPQPCTVPMNGTSGANAAQTVSAAAAGAGVRNYCSGVQVSWSGGAPAAGTKVEVKDGATVLGTYYLGDGTSVLGSEFFPALFPWRSSANAALNVVVDAAGGAVVTKVAATATTGP